MVTITFKEDLKVNVAGHLPAIGNAAPAFTLVKSDLSEISLQDLAGKTVILNIFPSLDTSTCAASVRRFNKEAAALHNVVILAVSADLPFAAGRFCTVEGIDKVSTGSVFRNPEFAQNYGVLMTDGPLKGLLARSIVVIDSKGKVVYTELVEELTNEPDYQESLDAVAAL
ncbi:putative thiol peroxidase [Bacteroidia bacterium]|nr:putative thiol peroxidase [Bacteroidia bacterium]